MSYLSSWQKSKSDITKGWTRHGVMGTLLVVYTLALWRAIWRLYIL